MKQNLNILLIFSLLFFSLIKAEGNNEKKETHPKNSTKSKSIKKIHNNPFRVQEELRPHGLFGISNEQIRQHWELYKGYVTQSNKLHSEIQEMIQNDKSNLSECSDKKRRFGFEFNGMILHEYYFANLKKDSEKLNPGKFLKALVKQFGSFEKWKEDFISTGKMRGPGWAILTLDPTTGVLTNIFIADHENGNIASYYPILVMDVWEHAYMVDYSATEKPNYISAFMQNINWKVVEDRFLETKKGKIPKRY